jgi:hypothetical protein
VSDLNSNLAKSMTHHNQTKELTTWFLRKIPAYNKNILVAMAPNSNGFEFLVFDFIWEEIKAISKNSLKSCGYAPYIMHMIEG